MTLPVESHAHGQIVEKRGEMPGCSQIDELVVIGVLVEKLSYERFVHIDFHASQKLEGCVELAVCVNDHDVLIVTDGELGCDIEGKGRLAHTFVCVERNTVAVAPWCLFTSCSHIYLRRQSFARAIDNNSFCKEGKSKENSGFCAWREQQKAQTTRLEQRLLGLTIIWE